MKTAKPDQSASIAGRYWQLELTLGILAFFAGFNALLTAQFLPSALRGWGDFRQLYTGGYMFRVGERANFYDYATQLRYEQRLVPIPTHLPANHLAYEHLVFAPLSFLTYKSAYLSFFVINVALVGLSAYLLLPSGRNLTLRWRFFVPALLAAFLPIWRALLQGQDSILLLALLAGGLFALQGQRPFAAGMLVGAGVFKFQIVLPIALLFVLWRQRRFVWGFCASAILAAAISFWMVGIHGMRQYFQMIAGMSVHLKSQADVVHYATSPRAMLNLRGLLTGTFARILPNTWLQALIALSSLIVLAVAGTAFLEWRKKVENGDDRSELFSLAVLAAALVSYHFIEHDASILIIPALLSLNSLSGWRGGAAVAVVVGTLAGVDPQYAFFAALPILALFVVELVEYRRRIPSHVFS